QDLNARLKFEETFMISAMKGDGVRDMLAWAEQRIPLGPWHFPEDHLTDLTLAITAAEVTREKLFLRIHEEIPYNTTVETEKFTVQKDGSYRIDQVVYVTRDTHKKIVLGAGGQTIKSIGAESRKELMEIFEVPVHLFLFVKVREKWGDDPERYREMGLEYPHQK
ncbi:MAG: Era, partial [Devosia sp.]|uniref:GTPase Era n=1 Tax=Devosia sp. TaxID=1871048 RepID=UPI002601B35F